MQPSIAYRTKLESVSSILADLHKALFDTQLAELQKSLGKDLGPGEKLNLLLNDPDYQWLRTMSRLMANIDEVVFKKEDVTRAELDQWMQAVRDLINPAVDTDFILKYRAVLAANPAIALFQSSLYEEVA